MSGDIIPYANKIVAMIEELRQRLYKEIKDGTVLNIEL